MGILPEGMKSASPNVFLKGVDFENEGQNLEVVGFEVITPKDAQYGAQEGNWLVEEGKLKVGESFKYSFKNMEGEEKVFETTSPGFFIGFSKCDPNAGDKVSIKRDGKLKKTRYTITHLDPTK